MKYMGILMNIHMKIKIIILMDIYMTITILIAIYMNIYMITYMNTHINTLIAYWSLSSPYMSRIYKMIPVTCEPCNGLTNRFFSPESQDPYAKFESKTNFV